MYLNCVKLKTEGEQLKDLQKSRQHVSEMADLDYYYMYE